MSAPAKAVESSTIVLAPKLAEFVERYRPMFAIENEQDEFYLRTVAASQLRVEQCRDEEMQVRTYLARRAERCWYLDRFAEAAKLGAKLAKDPERFAHELRATKHGCDWMLARWDRLGRALEGDTSWTPEQIAVAFDLLGVPAVFREGAQPFEKGETPAELVARATAELTDLREPLAELDEHRRSLVALGVDPERNPLVERLRREEAAALRRYRWAIARLRRIDESTPVPITAARPAPPPPPAKPPIPFEPMTDADFAALDANFWRDLVSDPNANFLDMLNQFVPEKPAPTPAAAPAKPAPVAAPAHGKLNRKQRRALIQRSKPAR